MNKIIGLWKSKEDRKYHVTEFIGYSPAEAMKSLALKEVYRAYFALTYVNQNVEDLLSNNNRTLLARFRDGNLSVFPREDRPNFPTRISINSIHSEYRKNS